MKRDYIKPKTVAMCCDVAYTLLSASLKSGDMPFGGNSSDNGVTEADSNSEVWDDLW